MMVTNLIIEMEAAKKMPEKGKMVSLVNDSDKLLREENELIARLAEIEQERKNAETQKEQERIGKINDAKANIESLKADCKVYRSKAIEAKVAQNADDEKLYKDYLRDVESQIAIIEYDFGLSVALSSEEQVEPEERKIKFLGISTTRAIWMISILVLVTGYVFWKLCLSEMAENPANDGVLRMLNTSGYRMLLNTMLWATSVLTGISYIFFFMPDVWRWLHNRIISDVSLKNDFEQCTPYQRLNFFTLNFWLPAFLFALCLLVIMG